MATKHRVTDSRGEVHKRTSQERVYSHCVVIRFKDRPASPGYRAIPAYSRAEWASTLALAERNASSWRKPDKIYVESVEVIPAEIIT